MLFRSEELRHLLLHNGTLWRWNRPIIGLENKKPGLRLENRVTPSGPTIVDILANTLFLIGLVYGLVNLNKSPELLLPFKEAEKNFYKSAKKSLRSRLTWIDGNSYSAQKLILEVLLPLASKSLKTLGLNNSNIHTYMTEIIQERTKSRQNGADWQKTFIKANGRNFNKLVKAYLKNQHSNTPVHAWQI